LTALVALSGAALVLGLASCKDEVTGEDGAPDIVFPDSNVSYNNHVQPLFDRTCAISGCHAGATPTADLSLESYDRTMARIGIVVPTEPDASILVMRIEGDLTPRMPLNRTPLNANQIAGIRRWILEGAQNN
jgi:hypothetical protein